MSEPMYNSRTPGAGGRIGGYAAAGDHRTAAGDVSGHRDCPPGPAPVPLEPLRGAGRARSGARHLRLQAGSPGGAPQRPGGYG